MEQKQFLTSISVILLITLFFTITPWYITYNKPVEFKVYQNIKPVTKELTDKQKVSISGSENIDYEYYLTKKSIVEKHKSLIPFVYKKDSIIKESKYIYTDENY